MQHVSDALWPLVVVRDLGGPLAPLTEAMHGFAARGRFVLLLECPSQPRSLLEHRALFASEHAAVHERIMGIAAVVGSNLCKHALLSFADRYPSNTLRIFGEADPAVRWSRRVVKRHADVTLSQRQVLSVFDELASFEGPGLDNAAPARTADELPALLEAFREPAFLVDGNGTIVSRNLAATRSHLGAEWVARVVDRSGAPEPARPGARVMRLHGCGLYLVVPVPAWELPQAFEPMDSPWPPRLRQTAELLLEGLSDRQIAERMETRPSTARTYVIRVFRRLGVHSRKELLPLLTRFDPGRVASSFDD